MHPLDILSDRQRDFIENTEAERVIVGGGLQREPKICCAFLF